MYLYEYYVCSQTCSNRCVNRLHAASGSPALGARAYKRGCNTRAFTFQQRNATPAEIVLYFAKHPYNAAAENGL